MFRFFESIAIVKGIPRNLFYHQSRIDKTFKHFYSKTESHHLDYLLSKLTKINHDFIKCKFSYSESEFKFFQLPYIQKSFKSFAIIENNSLEYSFKFTDRVELEKYAKKFSLDTQLLFSKNGMITDSSFSNLVFFDGYRWLTPKIPLLAGTMRASLLADWTIHEAEIHSHHLHTFTTFKLINALNSLEEAFEYPINLIKPEIIRY